MSGTASITIFLLIHLATTNSLPIDDLFDAIKKDNSEQVKTILKTTQNIASFINTQQPGSGQTPLMMSVLMGRVEAVKMLLDHPEVDVTIPEKDGYTPMHGAGFQGRAKIAKILIKDSRNIDPSWMHKDGFTPIHRACWGQEQRHTDTVEAFIKVGKVAWDEKTKKGKTCADITFNQETKKLLKKWAKKKAEL